MNNPPEDDASCFPVGTRPTLSAALLSKEGEAALRDLSGQGGKVAFVAGDVGRAADCERLAAETASRCGGIDVVCANAGVASDEPATNND
jgi:NAD(P)-dependent dehydrogenase (short-subunit alcohol dehydrogenase family)